MSNDEKDHDNLYRIYMDIAHNFFACVGIFSLFVLICFWIGLTS